MGRKRTNEKIRHYDFKGKTLIEKFCSVVKEGETTVSDIIGILSVFNAQYLSKAQSGFSAAEKEDVMDFYDFYMENFYDLTIDQMEDNWGDLPYILRLGGMFIDEENRDFLNSLIENITEKEKQEAKALAETLTQIRKDKLISVSTPSIQTQYTMYKTIPKDFFRKAKEELYRLCCVMIHERGAMTIRAFNDKTQMQEIFGIQTIPIGIWRPISKEEMINAHTLAPNGMRLAPEPGVEYT